MYILKQIPAPKLNSPLLKFARNRYSQSGEDGILEEIVSRLGLDSGNFVEFGAWDGIKYSNCAYFARHRNWNGVFIEGDPLRYKELRDNYLGYTAVSCLNRWVGFSEFDNLSTILEENKQSLDVDLLSIDIDGNDYHVLEKMGIRPKIIIVEINPSIPNDVFFVQAADPRVNQGSSLLAFLELAKDLNYAPACCTSANLIMVRYDQFEALNIPPFRRLCDLYAPKCDGRIFHGFDGKVYNIGMPRLIWHKGITVGPEDIQVLPNSDIRLKIYDE